jgi:hypothetical protein
MIPFGSWMDIIGSILTLLSAYLIYLTFKLQAGTFKSQIENSNRNQLIYLQSLIPEIDINVEKNNCTLSIKRNTIFELEIYLDDYEENGINSKVFIKNKFQKKINVVQNQDLHFKVGISLFDSVHAFKQKEIGLLKYTLPNKILVRHIIFVNENLKLVIGPSSFFSKT